MRHERGCSCSGEDRRLGEVDHVIGVTFLFIIVGRRVAVNRRTKVVGEALYMEQSPALFTCLFVLCTAVYLSITKGAPYIHRRCVSTSLMGESR